MILAGIDFTRGKMGSPDSMYFVAIEYCIATNQWNSFREPLCDDHAIKGIPVNEGKIGQGGGVGNFHLQDGIATAFDGVLPETLEGDGEAISSEPHFNGDFPETRGADISFFAFVIDSCPCGKTELRIAQGIPKRSMCVEQEAHYM
jgi:hypothetical protein